MIMKHKTIFTIFLSILLSFNINAQEKKWELIWSDEFNGNDMIDINHWNYHEGPVWNNELQRYIPQNKENVRLENGSLIIEAHKKGDKYTSGSINTRGKHAFRYGKVEVAAILPQGRGIWPAIWMMPETDTYGDWPRSGEIDIMEFVGYQPDIIHTTVHTESFNHVKKTEPTQYIQVNNLHTQFNRYSIEWNESEISFYVNDVQVNKFFKHGIDYKVWPFDHPFHLILNIAIGGSWGGAKGVDDSIFPQRMIIDYVRIYKQTTN